MGIWQSVNMDSTPARGEASAYPRDEEIGVLLRRQLHHSSLDNAAHLVLVIIHDSLHCAASAQRSLVSDQLHSRSLMLSLPLYATETVRYLPRAGSIAASRLFFWKSAEVRSWTRDDYPLVSGSHLLGHLTDSKILGVCRDEGSVSGSEEMQTRERY